MTDQSAKLIAPVAALHLLVKARLPENPTFAYEITSKDWFTDAQWSPAVAGSEAAIRVTVVFDALNTLYREVVHHRIRVRGTLKDGLPVDIDASDQAIGGLDIWERTLDCSASGERGRIYRNVWFFEQDVRRIIEPEPGSPATATERHQAPETERARQALRELYGDAIPTPTDLPNKLLVNAVNELLDGHKKPRVKRDAVLRAARRRR